MRTCLSKTPLALAGAAVLLAAASLLGACGKAGVSSSASRTLSAEVASVRQAAAANDPAGAQRGLDQIRSELTQLEGAGQVSASRASAILIDVSAVQAQLGAMQLSQIPPTTTSTSTTKAPPPAGHHKGKGEGDGGG